MHFRSQTTRTRALQLVLAAILAVGGGLTGTGCSGSGANGGEDTTPPAAPSSLSAMPDSNTVVLSWDPVGEAETYNVYRSTSSTDGPSGTPLNTGLSDPSYQDPDAENGTTYYYRVTAVDSAENESDASGEVSATPFTHPTALAGQSADSQVVLEWSEAAGAASYTVYRSTNSMDGTPDEPLTTEVSETTVTDTSAVNGTKYYYRVTAVNPGGEESAASNEVVKTPFAVPDRPSE